MPEKNYSEGYDGFKWGMTRSEVLEKMKGKPDWQRKIGEYDGIERYFKAIDISGWDVKAYLVFFDEKLYKVSFFYPIDNDDPIAIDLFKRTAELLKLKWGNPTDSYQSETPTLYNVLNWTGTTSSIRLSLSFVHWYELQWEYYDNALNKKAEEQQTKERNSRETKEVAKNLSNL